MMNTTLRPMTRNWLTASCSAVALILAMAGGAHAQSTTASISGTVAGGANADIVATNVQNGSVRRAHARADGGYILVGVEPGTYKIVATAGGKSSTQTATVQIGQAANLDITLGDNAADPTEGKSTNELVVVAKRLHEKHNSEVATNITTRQIENLPQDSRNFLNFAGLVAGVTVPTDPTQKTFSSGGQPPNQTNVFIDGANLKNNILQGGLVGQDSSRGNPFSQEAIQEFRVLVQNFKAEYEQGGTSIITAVTKSGTNEFHGTAYGEYQNNSLRAINHFDALYHNVIPPYSRWQYGANVGGPIIKDKLFFFLNYEGNHETGQQAVAFSPTFASPTSAHPGFSQYNGTFSKPFDEKVFFAKLTLFASENDQINLTGSYRRDNETIGFGGQTSYDTRLQRLNTVEGTTLNWKHTGAGWFNELLLDYGKYTFNPRPAKLGLINQNYYGIGDIGGATQSQNKQQESFTIKDDVTFSNLEWNGHHTVKFGLKFANYNETVAEDSSANAQYNYDPGQPGGWITPSTVNYSPAGKSANLSDNQIGIYVQDDWDVSHRLQVNLGIRWDYETNANNNSYVTPADQAAYLRTISGRPYANGQGNVADMTNYIADGKSRHGETDEFQPRLGFSYDFSRENNKSWVLSGGAGRYYDRTPLDNPIQEAFHSQFPYYTFQFAPTPTPGKITWDPKYLTVAGLQTLATMGIPGSGELDVLNNKTRAPYTDQFSLGVRHTMGDWAASVTVSRELGHRQFTWLWGNREPNDGGFTIVTAPPSNYGVVLINAEKNYYSTGIYVQIDKQYTEASGWDFHIAYTYLNAHKQGGDAYSLDYTSPAIYPDDNTSERHHLVISGSTRLPWQFHLSGVITLGTGQPYNANQTFDYLNRSSPTTGIHLGAAYPGGIAYKDVDLSLSKDFRLYGSNTIQLRFDVTNVFNTANFSCYSDYARDPNFGKPNCTTGLPRSAQIGARVKF